MATAPVRLNNSLRVVITLTNPDETVIDVSTATAQEITLRGPSVRIVETSTFTTDGTDGKIQVDIAANRISEVGTWRVQGKVNLPGPPATEQTSDVETFDVEGNL